MYATHATARKIQPSALDGASWNYLADWWRYFELGAFSYFWILVLLRRVDHLASHSVSIICLIRLLAQSFAVIP
jgi:hypothetical protein